MKTRKCTKCLCEFVPPAGKPRKHRCEHCDPEPKRGPGPGFVTPGDRLQQRITSIPIPDGVPLDPPETRFPAKGELDFILAANSGYRSIGELVDDLAKSTYSPTIRCDKDHRLLYVVAELEARGLGERLFVYFTPIHPARFPSGVATCWGFPAAALQRAAKAARVESGRPAANAPTAARIAYCEIAGALEVSVKECEHEYRKNGFCQDCHARVEE